MNTETSERLSKALLEWHEWIKGEIEKRESEHPNTYVAEYNQHVVYGLKLALAAMQVAVESK